MKKTLLAAALLSSLTSFGAVAADKAPEPSYTLTGNIGLVSDYRFRGISQSNKKPAIQGGLDLALANGLSFGTWTSNVSSWANTGGQQEVDLYGGYARDVFGATLSIGGIQYWYPRNTPAVSQNTFEYYIGVAYGPFAYKLNKANGNWFGEAASGASYHDFSLSYAVSEKLGAKLHIGRQTLNEDDASRNIGFTDTSLSLTYDLGNSLSAGLTASRVKLKDKTDGEGFFTATNGKKLYESGLVASITKTF